MPYISDLTSLGRSPQANDLLVISPAGTTDARSITWNAALGPTELAALIAAMMATLPTTLPATSGVLWNNGGTLCVS